MNSEDPEVDLAWVRSQLENGRFSVTSVNNVGDTRLIHACRTLSAEVIFMLLEFGSDVHARGESGYTPLHRICDRKPPLPETVSIVQELIRKGANISATDIRGRTCVHLACRSGNLGAVDVLIEKGMDVNAPSRSKFTPMHYAACVNAPKTMERLLSAGANINSTSEDGDTLLHVACLNYAVDSVRMLLRLGVNVNAKNNKGNPPLMYACTYKPNNECAIHVARMLLVKGAKPVNKVACDKAVRIQANMYERLVGKERLKPELFVLLMDYIL